MIKKKKKKKKKILLRMFLICVKIIFTYIFKKYNRYLPIVEEGNKRTWNPERMYLPTPRFTHTHTYIYIYIYIWEWINTTFKKKNLFLSILIFFSSFFLSWFKHHKDVSKLNNYVSGLVTARWELRLKEKAQGGTSR